jgi:hypothetical protein
MPDLAANPAPTELEPKKLKPYEHVIAGLPFGLIAIGGMIGGACGGCAYALNTAIFKKDLPTPLKYLYTTLVTLGAVAVYFGAVIALGLLYPGFFKK